MNINLECNHSYGNAKYDPERIREEYFDGTYTAHNGGVTKYPNISFKYTTKDRWSRTCSKCGEIEYSYEFNFK